MLVTVLLSPRRREDAVLFAGATGQWTLTARILCSLTGREQRQGLRGYRRGMLATAVAMVTTRNSQFVMTNISNGYLVTDDGRAMRTHRR